MISEREGHKEHCYEILIKPNRSMTANGMMLFVFLVGVAVFLVTLRFVLLGAWVVLPFAALEVVLLAAGFWLFERASRYRETVRLTQTRFSIVQEGVNGRRSWDFNPHWVRVNLLLDPSDWYPSKLLIKSHDQQVEIGACLTNQERDELSQALMKKLLPPQLDKVV